jgi:hypothetical protein
MSQTHIKRQKLRQKSDMLPEGIGLGTSIDLLMVADQCGIPLHSTTPKGATSLAADRGDRGRQHERVLKDIQIPCIDHTNKKCPSAPTTRVLTASQTKTFETMSIPSQAGDDPSPQVTPSSSAQGSCSQGKRTDVSLLYNPPTATSQMHFTPRLQNVNGDLPCYTSPHTAYTASLVSAMGNICSDPPTDLLGLRTPLWSAGVYPQLDTHEPVVQPFNLCMPIVIRLLWKWYATRIHNKDDILFLSTIMSAW